MIAHYFGTKAMRDFLWARDDGKCRYCGRDAEAIDHVVPRRHGGSNDPFTNLVLACGACNSTKGAAVGMCMTIDGSLTWLGMRVAPDCLFGAALMKDIQRTRVERKVS